MNKALQVLNMLEKHPADHGSKWIRRVKRLAIYLRDGLQCGWCGSTTEEGAKLALDHLIPHSKGGSNQEGNLISSCSTCNRRRGAMTQAAFARQMADELSAKLGTKITADELLRVIRRNKRRKLDKYKMMAKDLLSTRSFTAVVYGDKEDDDSDDL